MAKVCSYNLGLLLVLQHIRAALARKLFQLHVDTGMLESRPLEVRVDSRKLASEPLELRRYTRNLERASLEGRFETPKPEVAPLEVRVDLAEHLSQACSSSPSRGHLMMGFHLPRSTISDVDLFRYCAKRFLDHLLAQRAHWPGLAAKLEEDRQLPKRLTSKKKYLLRWLKCWFFILPNQDYMIFYHCHWPQGDD